MPYIKKKDRDIIDIHTNRLSPAINKIGQLNYAMTRIALLYVNRRKRSYFTFLIVIGTFICALLEFYRRWVAPYEDMKMKQNGDIDGQVIY